MKIDDIINEIEFEPDLGDKWDFDCPLISISSRGYDWSEKSFYVGYYILDQEGESVVTLVEDELFDEDFETLRQKVRKWYKDHYIEALQKAMELGVNYE